MAEPRLTNVALTNYQKRLVDKSVALVELHVEVVEARFSVGERHHLLSKCIDLWHGRVLHGFLMGVGEDDIDKMTRALTVLAPYVPADLVATRCRCLELLRRLTHLVQLRS